MHTVVSCPGKVLLAGGYLVLDRAYKGLVLATASRFYTVIRDGGASQTLSFTVSSPQFLGATWHYDCVCDAYGGFLRLGAPHGQNTNLFIELAVEIATRTVQALKGELPARLFQVSVVGDNDFYSQTDDGQADLQPFRHLQMALENVHKTGLGSSAAMLSSLLACILAHCDIDILSKRALLHNLAQYAHSMAQGKIGSGFDVSAAIYGSQIYRRFDPLCLPQLSGGGYEPPVDFLSALDPSLPHSAWRKTDMAAEVANLSLPPYTTIILADVDRGSNTPSMVRKVMSWRAAHLVEANQLWTNLADNASAVATIFARLRRYHDEHPEPYLDAMKHFLNTREEAKASNSNLLADLYRLQTTLSLLRRDMRTMGEMAEVPIEPPAQTALLDEISLLPGVLGGGVPGAGGFDAVWFLVISSDETTTCLVELSLKKYPLAKVRPLSENARIVGTGDAAQQTGLRMEQLTDVRGLEDSLDAV